MPNLMSPVYLAITRPPLVWGVIHSYFYFNCISSLLLFLMHPSVYSVFCFVMIHLAGTAMTIWDHNFPRIFLAYIKHCLECTHNTFWGSNSYDPF